MPPLPKSTACAAAFFAASAASALSSPMSISSSSAAAFPFAFGAAFFSVGTTPALSAASMSI